MTSDTQMRYGSLVPRQGRSRRARRYQPVRRRARRLQGSAFGWLGLGTAPIIMTLLDRSRGRGMIETRKTTVAMLSVIALACLAGPAQAQCHEEHDKVALAADPRTAKEPIAPALEGLG